MSNTVGASGGDKKKADAVAPASAFPSFDELTINKAPPQEGGVDPNRDQNAWKGFNEAVGAGLGGPLLVAAAYIRKGAVSYYEDAQASRKTAAFAEKEAKELYGLFVKTASGEKLNEEDNKILEERGLDPEDKDLQKKLKQGIVGYAGITAELNEEARKADRRGEKEEKEPGTMAKGAKTFGFAMALNVFFPGATLIIALIAAKPLFDEALKKGARGMDGHAEERSAAKAAMARVASMLKESEAAAKKNTVIKEAKKEGATLKKNMKGNDDLSSVKDDSTVTTSKSSAAASGTARF
jgi:hypothetical protein